MEKIPSRASVSRITSLRAVQVQEQKEEGVAFADISVVDDEDDLKTENIVEKQYNNQKAQLQKQLLETASSKSSSTVPISRALKLFDIVWNEILSPVYTTLSQKGLPSSSSDEVEDDDEKSWNDFWLTYINRKDGTGSKTLAEQCVLALEKMGPTYVKFGQALSSRPDVVPRTLAQALSQLQDSMQPFDTEFAKDIIMADLQSKFDSEEELEEFVSSLSEVPVAAASIGQVYEGRLPSKNGGQKVAIKVQRPGISDIVDEDLKLLRMIVQFVESIPAISAIQKDQEKLVETDLSGAVEEFMSRIIEELDYRNEAKNIELFYKLYSHKRHLKHHHNNADDEKLLVQQDDDRIEVVVPEVYMDLCTDRVLVMEWIEGTHMIDLESENSTKESLSLIEQCIQCTFSQLLDTGVLHADPHGGNLLKVIDHDKDGKPFQRLGYVDFGLLSSVPVSVRDGLVCAVAEMVFAKNVTAVANLFVELQLIPEEVLKDPAERIALSVELNSALSSVLKYESTGSNSGSGTATQIPSLRFDKLLDALSRLVPRFEFSLPPYFLNNARALGTLEGMAREIDPTFNVLQALYPYVLGRLLSNPTGSPVVEATLQSLIRSPITGNVDSKRVQKLVEDSTILTGYSKRRVIMDIFKSKNGPRLAKIIMKEQIRQTIGKRFSRMSNYLRL